MEKDHITEDLMCVLSTLESCSTFTIRGNRQAQQLEVVRRDSKCLHFYSYYLDAKVGFMHIRLQSWFPFQIQVYVNGREYLARHLDQQQVAYERYENSFTRIGDLLTAQAFCETFNYYDWPLLLNALAERVNPMLQAIQQAGFGC